MQKELIIRELPTAFCHGSSLCALRDGGLLCCWFGGSREGEADTAIYASRCSGGSWSVPVKLADGAEANWNPVLFYRRSGVLQLFYKEGQCIADWRTMVMLSEDDGRSWSAPEELVPGDTGGGRGPVRSKPVRLQSGRVLAGASAERGIWRAFADISDDDGRSWRKSRTVSVAGLQYLPGEKTAESSIAVSEQSFYGRGVIQPSLWQDSDGSVHMLLRSSEGHIYRSDSTDGGCSWCGAYPLDLPNNNSGLDLVRTQQGRLLLACNPVAANWGERSPLSLFASDDGGSSWEKLLDLETGPGEFSYPAVILQGETLYIAYTWKRRNIACVRLELAGL